MILLLKTSRGGGEKSSTRKEIIIGGKSGVFRSRRGSFKGGGVQTSVGGGKKTTATPRVRRLPDGGLAKMLSKHRLMGSLCNPIWEATDLERRLNLQPTPPLPSPPLISCGGGGHVTRTTLHRVQLLMRKRMSFWAWVVYNVSNSNPFWTFFLKII